MVKFQLIPNQRIIAEARQSKKSPWEYLGETTGWEDNGDPRRMDKYGIEYLEDVMLTRSDGTRVIIHECGDGRNNYSEVEGFKKYEIFELNERNQFDSSTTIYSEEIDFARMQEDPSYLQSIGDGLLERSRIVRKQGEATQEEFVYVGRIKKDYDGKYKKTIQKSAEKRIIAGRELAKKRVDQANREREIQRRRATNINSILEKLPTLTNKQIEQLMVYVERMEAQNEISFD